MSKKSFLQDAQDKADILSHEAVPAAQSVKTDYTFIILCLAIAIACIIVFKDYLLARKVYLFKDIGSDSINIAFPSLVHMSDYIRENGIPAWTFSQGLGQNIFPFWLSDFFSSAMIFFCSKQMLPFCLVWMEVIKIILAGALFYGYLREQQLDRFASGICAFLYAFCGYIILGGCWAIFSTEALYAAMILYGFERWLNSGKWLLYLFGITCLAFLQPFFLFMYTIFLAAYIPFRYVDVRQVEWRGFLIFILKTIGLSALGVALSAYQLLPDLLQYMESPRVGGAASLFSGLRSEPLFALSTERLRFSTIFRAFSSDMLGTGSNFKGWANYLESPLFYCGILCLVTCTQFMPGCKKTKQKFAYSIFALIWIIPLIFPFFRYTFWAYSGNYFRTFSLMITIILVVYTARSLHQIVTTGNINKTVLFITAAFLLFLLYTPPEQYAAGIDRSLRTAASILVCLYTILLLALAAKGRCKSFAQAFVAVVCFVELVSFSYKTVNDRDVITAQDLREKTGYNDYTLDAVKFIKGIDKEFYRVGKDYSSGSAIHASINDAKVQGYFGTSSYNSFNQINYIRFLGEMKIINPANENETRWAPGTLGRVLLFSLVSGKYWLSKQPAASFSNQGLIKISTIGDINIYRNIYNMPLAFTYNQVVEEPLFLTLDTAQKDFYLFKACVVAANEKAVDIFPRIISFGDPSKISEELESNFAARMQDRFKITKFTENDIYGEITVPQSRILFFSIPFDKGWHGKINGADTTLHRVNLGFTGMLIPAGKSVVELHFTPRLMKLGFAISMISILALVYLLLATGGKGLIQACSAKYHGMMRLRDS